MDVMLAWCETRSNNSLIKDVRAIWAQFGFEYKVIGIQTLFFSCARHCSFKWNCLKRSGAKKKSSMAATQVEDFPTHHLIAAARLLLTDRTQGHFLFNPLLAGTRFEP